MDPVAALFTSALDVTIEEAVVMIDALLTSADDYPGLIPGRPVYTIEDIEAKLGHWRTFPGHRTIRAALPLAREGVESPKETETRRLIVRAGLPEPVVQHEVCDGARLVARADLAYPELKIAIEYEGDGHRTDKAQWRRDIRRQRDLEDRGWIVIRLTQHDLEEGAEALLSRIRRAIASRIR
ncbi:endonuclease domain-containing protein [Microbacterium sp. NPDC058345]|uniref:endonuclease domain-containing protein n=1 Tax=Microbacterium sp. NPDC058345 TaxID=3346455 RepID=UPI0036563FD1